MNESANVEMVQRLYADFGRGDIPPILAALDPKVEWINAGSNIIRMREHATARRAGARVFRNA